MHCGLRSGPFWGTTRLQGEPGPVACVKFQSLTGQHVSRQPLLGKCADGRVLGGELEGDFPWRQVRGEVQAPESAKRAPPLRRVR